MTRNEKRIRKAAAAVGVEITSVVWEPIGMAFEMCGPEGGWIVNEGEYLGYNVAQVIADIQRGREPGPTGGEK